MKQTKILLLTFFTLVSMHCLAQFSSIGNNPEELAQLRNSTTYYLITGNEQFDTEMAAVLKELWTITPTQPITEDEMKMKIKEKTASFILPVVIGAQTHGYHYLVLINGGKKRVSNYDYNDLLAYCPINFWGDERTLFECHFRLRNMVQSMITALELTQAKNLRGLPIKIATDLQKIYNAKSGTIKDRTLLICSDQVSKKSTEEEIKKVYPFKFELCDKEKIAEAIKNKSEEYCYFQPGITMNKCMFIFDAANGDVLYFDYQMSGMNITPSDLTEVLKEIKAAKKSPGKTK